MSNDTRLAAYIEEAPTTASGIFQRLGPGLILAGNIVGSGELIATPGLGTRAGYSFLWLILFSCLIKVFFQIEIGRYALSTGRTSLDSFNDLPGPRLGVNWLLWYWLFMMIACLVQVGGMCGGVAQSLRMALPIFGDASDAVWAVITGLSVIVLLWWGRYRMIERLSILFVGLFTLVTIYSVAQLQSTENAMRWSDLVEGFSFHSPARDASENVALLGMALTAFGITGVGASELVAYPYWCLEKGYGRFVGPREETDSWARRARAWIRVMGYDAWLSAALFTTATVAFYILGAALLHPRFLETGNVPKGSAMVERLSAMYVASFGDMAKWIFLLGAFSVLYSTFLISTAANSRMLADWLAVFNVYPAKDDEKRNYWIALFCVLFPVISTGSYLLVKEPLIMVAVSGVMQALMLPMLGYGILFFAYKRTDTRVRGGRLWYAILWISFLSMSVAALYMAWASVMDYQASTSKV